MRYFTKDRFNFIDVAIAQLVALMCADQMYVAAAATLVIGGIVSGFMQAATE